mgnify:CR=1 FL=1
MRASLIGRFLLLALASLVLLLPLWYWRGSGLRRRRCGWPVRC